MFDIKDSKEWGFTVIKVWGDTTVEDAVKKLEEEYEPIRKNREYALLIKKADDLDGAFPDVVAIERR